MKEYGIGTAYTKEECLEQIKIAIDKEIARHERKIEKTKLANDLRE